MSNPYIHGVVKCETCDKEMWAVGATRLDGANEDFYLCDECMYGHKLNIKTKPSFDFMRGALAGHITEQDSQKELDFCNQDES
jgi:hypothetical protein